MFLAENRHKLLYEVRPDLFPEGFLTPLEVALWYLFYEERDANRDANRDVTRRR